MGTRIKFPEPFGLTDTGAITYLNELVRTLNDFDERIFSQETGLVFGAARKRPFVSIDSAYSAGPNDSVLLVDSSASNVTITLPEALDVKGTFLDVKKTDNNGTTTVSVEGSGDELPFVLSGTDRPSLTLFSDGSKYWII